MDEAETQRDVVLRHDVHKKDMNYNGTMEKRQRQYMREVRLKFLRHA